MASSSKLSMAEFKALRQSRAKVEIARQKEREGDPAAARVAYEEAISAAPGSITALVGLAMLLWSDAPDQRTLDSAEVILRRALTAAACATSQQELDMAKIATTKLCLFLCQEGREKEACETLLSAGYRYRLSTKILRYGLPVQQIRNGSGVTDHRNGSSVTDPGVGQGAGLVMPVPRVGGAVGIGTDRIDYVQAVENALPVDMLLHLQRCFGKDSLYWTEHNYHSEQSSYFSYLHAISRDSSPRSNMEQIIEHVWGLCVQRFPDVADAHYCEWWAHCRPHSSGHQMHFDSDDEGVGGVRNPIVSTVVYLTECVGGPTLVTNQRLKDHTLATKGWLVHPKQNRLVIFDGSTLHGVVPGRGCSSNPGGRRVTLMMAFWREIAFRPSESEEPGASRPFPARRASRYTWADSLYDLRPEWGGGGGLSAHTCEDVDEIEEITGVWERSDGVMISEVNDGGDMPDYSQCFQGF